MLRVPFKSNEVMHKLPTNVSELNNYMCESSFNQAGQLCGKCRNVLYSSSLFLFTKVYSLHQKNGNWLKYLGMAFGPVTCSIHYLCVIVSHLPKFTIIFMVLF